MLQQWHHLKGETYPAGFVAEWQSVSAVALQFFCSLAQDFSATEKAVEQQAQGWCIDRKQETWL